MSPPAVLDKVPPSPRNPSVDVEDLLDVRAKLTVVSIFPVDAAHKSVQISGRQIYSGRTQPCPWTRTSWSSSLMGTPESTPVPNQALWQPDIIFVEGSTL